MERKDIRRWASRMKHGPAGLKDNVYRAVPASSSFRGLLSSSCANVHQSPRAVAFMNSEGRFRRLFHIEQRQIPLRCLLSDFRDKFCSRGGSLTHPPFGVSIFRLALCVRLIPSSLVREFSLTSLSWVAIFMRGRGSSGVASNK